MTCPEGAHTIETWRGRDVCIECGIEPSKQTAVEIDHANHDPLCPSAYTFGACECALIATVRQDERAGRTAGGLGVTLEHSATAGTDLAELLAIAAHDPALTDNTSMPAHDSAVDALAWLRDATWDVYLVRVDGVPAGYIALHDPDLSIGGEAYLDHRETDEYLLPQFRGRRVMSAAWEPLLRAVPTGTKFVAEIWQDNASSIRRYERDGWEKVGEFWWQDGDDVDSGGMRNRYTMTVTGSHATPSCPPVPPNMDARHPKKYADSWLEGYKANTFPSDWAGHVAAYTDDPVLSKLFWACATEWAPGFVDFYDEARSARDIKITPIGRALLDMVEQRLKDGGALPSAPPAPDSREREQNQKYEVEISDASDTHAPWCRDLDCFGCECLHENVTEDVCDDCGEMVVTETQPPEPELTALRAAARAAANDGRYILRTCWVCNLAHEHLRSSDCLIECFGCGDFYYRGVRITDDNPNSGESEVSEEEAAFNAGRTMGVLDSITAIAETWEAHKDSDWDEAAQVFTIALDALLANKKNAKPGGEDVD